MTFFLLTISFLLHAISLYLIYHLYVTNKKNVKEKQNQAEIIQIFDTYLKEIKEENKRLISFHEKRQHENNTTNEKQTKHKKEHKLQDKMENRLTDLIDKSNDSIETSLYAKVLQLHQKGLAVDDIAKQLDCGKTEAELIIKFYG